MVLVLSLAVPQLWSIWYRFIYYYKMIISACIVHICMYIYHMNLWSATLIKITGLINVDQCKMYQLFQHDIGIFVYLSCTHHYKMYIPSVFVSLNMLEGGGETKPLFMVYKLFHSTLILNTICKFKCIHTACTYSLHIILYTWM